MENIRIIEAFRNLFYSPLYVTQALGFFEREGLEVTSRPRELGEQVIPMLRDGLADIALTGIMRSLVAADAGETDYPLAFIEVNSRDGFMLLSRQPRDGFLWSDLEGKTVITYKEPPTPGMCLLHVLKVQTVDTDSVHFSTDRLFPEAIEAFKEGFGDFIQLPEPQAQQLIADGHAHLAVPMGPFVGPLPYSSFAATRTFLVERGETIMRFTRAVYSGQRWLAQHDAATIAPLTSAYLPGVSLDVLETGVERYKNQETWAKDPLLRPEGYYRLEGILRDGGLIRGTHRYDDHVVTDFAEAVMAGQ